MFILIIKYKKTLKAKKFTFIKTQQKIERKTRKEWESIWLTCKAYAFNFKKNTNKNRRKDK